MIIFAFLIVILIIFVAFILYKVLKEQKEFEKEDKKKNKEEAKPEPVKVTEVMNDKKFEMLLEEAKNNEEKLEILERTIQDTLRKSVKEKNVYNTRICNTQLKKIDEIKDKKGI